MENVIKLYNRYGSDIYLKKIKGDDITYQLCSTKEKDLDYTRIGYDSSDTRDVFNFIDPPGGPFLQVGGMVEDKVIKHISGVHDDFGRYMYIIELEK